MAAKTINMATAHTHTHARLQATHSQKKWQRTNDKQNQITIRNSIECAKRDTRGYCLCPSPPRLFTSLHLCECVCVCVCEWECPQGRYSPRSTLTSTANKTSHQSKPCVLHRNVYVLQSESQLSHFHTHTHKHTMMTRERMTARARLFCLIVTKCYCFCLP